VPQGYEGFLRDLKERSQVKAALAVNRELVLLYWSIGRDVLAQQHQRGWGAKVIDRLAADLRSAFPDTRGFSPRNLKYMRAFALAWPDEPIVQQLAAQIPWFHMGYEIHHAPRDESVSRILPSPGSAANCGTSDNHPPTSRSAAAPVLNRPEPMPHAPCRGSGARRRSGAPANVWAVRKNRFPTASS
jgi:hypothetical protein